MYLFVHYRTLILHTLKSRSHPKPCFNVRLLRLLKGDESRSRDIRSWPNASSAEGYLGFEGFRKEAFKRNGLSLCHKKGIGQSRNLFA